MADTYEMDELLEDFGDDIEALEAFESDESDELAERRGRRSRFRPRVPTGRNLYKPRMPAGGANHVTQAQLQTALARVGTQIKASADATKALSTRFNALSDKIDKEIATRRKDTMAIRQGAQSSQQMAILPLLLARPSPPEVKTEKLTFKDEAGNNKTVEVVTSVVPKKDDSTMLVVLMMMMMGSTGSGTPGQAGTGSDGMMAMLPLILLLNRP